jgi:glycosyltransferase involved in cell wall biosynthesis
LPIVLNVLFIVPSLRRAGAETQVIDLVNSLRDPEINAYLLCFQNDLSQRDRMAESITFHHVPRRSKYDLSFINGIAEIIDREAINIVHATLEFSMLVGWLAIQRAKRKPRLIAAIHTTLLLGLKEKAHDRLIYRWIFRRCDSIVFVCQKQADYWVRRYPFMNKKVRVIHNGIDLVRFSTDFPLTGAEDYRVQYGVPEDASIISCIAGFRPEKGHDLLISAFRCLDSKVHLFLAGDGERRENIESLVDISGLSGRVHFLGNLSDVRPLLRITDITVLASTSVETFSIAMLESMAMGVPMVAPDIGGLSEAIYHDQTGWIYPAGDVGSLASLLDKGIRDRARLKAVGKRARALVEARFSKDIMADTMASLLHDIGSHTR